MTEDLATPWLVARWVCSPEQTEVDGNWSPKAEALAWLSFLLTANRNQQFKSFKNDKMIK